MEKNIIQNHIDQKNIISYHRYVDDVFCIVKKGLKDEILNEMNAFDPFLEFTIENMTENKLNFLDTTVNFENDQLFLTQFRKPEASDCLINFHKGVAPKAYKFSTLIGEVYRANNCNTTEEGLEKSIRQIEEIFLKNQFPKSLIKSKIAEVVDRKFGPVPTKLFDSRKKKIQI